MQPSDSSRDGESTDVSASTVNTAPFGTSSAVDCVTDEPSTERLKHRASAQPRNLRPALKGRVWPVQLVTPSMPSMVLATLGVLTLGCVAVGGLAAMGWGLAQLTTSLMHSPFTGLAAVALGAGWSGVLGWATIKLALRVTQSWWKVELWARGPTLQLRRSFLGRVASEISFKRAGLKQVELVKGGLLLDTGRTILEFKTAPLPVDDRIELLRTLKRIAGNNEWARSATPAPVRRSSVAPHRRR